MNLDATYRPTLSPVEMQRFARKDPTRSTLAIIRVYALLVGVTAAGIAYGGWAVVLAFPFVAALQHALSILQHEAVHGLLYRNHRLNDFIGAYFLSYPIGFSMDYRLTHFAHHRWLGEVEDPDLPNYRPFPADRKTMMRKALHEFTGIGAVKQFFGSSATSSGARPHLFRIGAAQAVIFFFFYLAGQPLMYFALWLLPLVTLTKGFTQFRNLAEHLIRPNSPRVNERLRTFQSSFLERFFFAPLNFNYHAEHHWFTNVPYYRLPALRKLLRERIADYSEYAEWTPSYVSAWKEAIGNKARLSS